MRDPGAIVKEMQLTEKSNLLAERERKYFFRVDPRANKIDIKRAVESLFNVEVANVNTMKYAGKRKRERMVSYGKRADWKRAVVTLKEGHSIDLA